MRRWKLLKPQLGHVQSPGRGRFLDGGKGVSSGGPPGGWEPAARSRTREEEGATSMARSLRARPFMLSDSAACTRSQVSSRVRLGVVAMQGRQQWQSCGASLSRVTGSVETKCMVDGRVGEGWRQQKESPIKPRAGEHDVKRNVLRRLPRRTACTRKAAAPRAACRVDLDRMEG